MKRWIMILVLTAAAPAMATVNFTATDAGSGKLQIAYTTTDGDLPRGVALRVSLSDGAMVDFASPVVVAPEFNTFIDWANSNPLNYQVGNGSPLALPTAAGALAGDASEFSICMGVLDQAGGQAAGRSSTTLINIQLKGIRDGGQTTATITADTLRGPASGVVGSVLASNLPITTQIKGHPLCSCECLKTSAPFYNDWVKFGKPACWCYARNCHGDADGLRQGIYLTGYWYVGTNDLNILVKGWQVKEAPKGPGIMSIPGGICADFARDNQGSALTGFWRVGTSDLNILIRYWQVKEGPKGPGVPDCMATGYYYSFVSP
jgi:hypothetical protein